MVLNKNLSILEKTSFRYRKTNDINLLVKLEKRWTSNFLENNEHAEENVMYFLYNKMKLQHYFKTFFANYSHIYIKCNLLKI